MRNTVRHAGIVFTREPSRANHDVFLEHQQSTITRNAIWRQVVANAIQSFAKCVQVLMT